MIIQERLKILETANLSAGGHNSFEQGYCAMELVSYIAGEPWSDHPECVCPVISAFLRNWNDSLPNEDRARLIMPLIVKTIGTRSEALEERRSLMAADWLVRVHTPAWLRLAGLSTQADVLAGLPEITSMAQVPSIRGPIEAARKNADAARDAAGAAGAAARDAARDAAGAAAWAARDAAWAAWDAASDAAGDAAGAAAWAAAWDAAWDAAGDAAWDAAWAAAWDAARAAGRDAARAKLKPTVVELQSSVAELIERMCALQEA